MSTYRRRYYVNDRKNQRRRPLRPYESLQTRSEREAEALELEPATAGYVAGIIDGEGSLCLNRRYEAGRAHHARSFLIVVSNTHKPLCDWLQARFGGAVYQCSPGTGGHKPGWRWDLWAIESRRLLRSILPFLIVKRRHADVVLAYHDAVTRKDLLAQTALAAEIDALNRKGPPRS